MVFWMSFWWLLIGMVFMYCILQQIIVEKFFGVYFFFEFVFFFQGSFLEDIIGEQFFIYCYDDQILRNIYLDEDKDGNWDVWGDWSDCFCICGGGVLYFLWRCLIGRNCEGQNIWYKICSNYDCFLDVEDFRVQQCLVYNDVQYQGCYYEWFL